MRNCPPFQAPDGRMLRLPDLARIMRFGLVGVAATLTYAGVAAMLSYGQLAKAFSATPASFVSYLIAMPISYFGHKWLTFGSRGSHAQEAPRFVASALLGIAISCFLPLTLVEWLGYTPAVSIVAATILVPLTNYVVLGLWVFPTSGEQLT